jgi:peptide/nickel transport system permease protein
MGVLLVQSVTAKEPYMVMGFLMVTAVVVLAANLVADALYAVLDPRIRLGR